VDDHPAPVLRANGGFKAVSVPAGRHAVTLRFEARLLLIGIGLFSLFGVAALGLAVGLGARALWRDLRVLTDGRRTVGKKIDTLLKGL
jgi:hypothetical protein